MEFDLYWVLTPSRRKVILDVLTDVAVRNSVSRLVTP
jgi:hypothetical protein